jgi:hypothetical protein
MPSCFEWDIWELAGRNWVFILDNNGGNWRANMTQMPEARLNGALVDTQGVAIVLSSPNLIGPLASGPRTF